MLQKVSNYKILALVEGETYTSANKELQSSKQYPLPMSVRDTITTDIQSFSTIPKNNNIKN